jgi:eukaryotic-like serine/threonine-protein kinase
MGLWDFLRSRSARPAPAPAPKEIDAFTKLIAKSGLVTKVEFQTACADFKVNSNSISALDQLCAHLTAKGLLTSWQCEKLREGKWKGFFLDGYCLLSQLSKDMTTSTYLCKEVATGKQAAMSVIPPWFDKTNDGRIHYTIREFPDEPKSGEA